jgi:hypothetical protein
MTLHPEVSFSSCAVLARVNDVSQVELNEGRCRGLVDLDQQPRPPGRTDTSTFDYQPWSDRE